jgi:hypothetical protein
MASQASEARTRYIQRLQWKPDKDKPATTRYDSEYNSQSARKAMIARIAGRTFSTPPSLSKHQYREDSNERDPLGWYKTLLLNSGYHPKQVAVMLQRN